ncbi:ABC transporter ATP-binding protein [Timonella sp. A28]|uniref:ABC transporter ATP-binding protein n=1 Tax=Timonella sp. A28 TaxID=3442640 RepID=UPI003EB6F2F4
MPRQTHTTSHAVEDVSDSDVMRDRIPALEVRGLSKSYGDRTVVTDMSFTAQLGQVTAVLGPNGAGKTTTIECCEGLRTPDAGSIRVFGETPATTALQRAQVGVMLQDGGLPSSVKAIEMLKHVARLFESPRSVDDLVTRLGMSSFARTSVRRLSGGQRQRVALAAALLGRPQLVFLDEPSAGMDPQSRHAVWELIRELRDDNVAVVLTTHLMDEAETLSDMVYIVDNGAVIAQGTPHELLNSASGTLTVETAVPCAAEDVASFISGLYGSEYGVSQVHPHRFVVRGDATARLVAQLAGWLADNDVMVTSLTSGKQTLEDVFLDLTGRHLR